ncbi:hypothetical protein V8G54_036527 [Vigna mungo]|uniref:Glycine-rich protein n=1 Tax=Vigna mungo TaxID=3915 RepID=A0AAQ3MHV1_VIGMU
MAVTAIVPPLNGQLCVIGVVKSKRSIWRLKTITDFFWAIINFIGVFFTTMFSMEKSDSYRKGAVGKKWDGGSPGGGPGGGGGGGPYGGGPRGPPRGGLDNIHFLPVAPAVVKCWRSILSIYVMHFTVRI